MKHLIETTDPSSLTKVDYNRIILNSATDDVIVRGGVNTNGYPYVDLGLPSGTLWAKCNVGADKETDYGDYFQWGETKPHDTGIPYDWANYKYCNGSETSLTKYTTAMDYGENADKKRTLDLEDDAARANMGGDWRMPTITEYEELVQYTTRKWLTDYNGTGVNGTQFTSKADTSKYIFIPASGYYYNDDLKSVGEDGGAWSSSRTDSDSKSARYLRCKSTGPSTTYYPSRIGGYPVRGVL